MPPGPGVVLQDLPALDAPDTWDGSDPDRAITGGAFPVVETDEGATTLVGVSYTPRSTITGADTDSRTLQLLTADGSVDDLSGAVVVAELALTAGVNLPGGSPHAIPIVDSTLKHFVYWKSISVGTGIPDPGGSLSIAWS